MADEIEQPDDPPTTLLGLWRAHQVEIAITRESQKAPALEAGDEWLLNSFAS